MEYSALELRAHAFGALYAIRDIEAVHPRVVGAVLTSADRAEAMRLARDGATYLTRLADELEKL